jgi:hypothetical protein
MSTWSCAERGGPALRVDPKAARHPEVHEQRVLAHPEQQVLAASVERLDHAAGDSPLQGCGNRPAQSPVVYVHCRDPAADDMRRDAATRGLDFGQFGHRRPKRKRPQAYRRAAPGSDLLRCRI